MRITVFIVPRKRDKALRSRIGTVRTLWDGRTAWCWGRMLRSLVGTVRTTAYAVNLAKAGELRSLVGAMRTVTTSNPQDVQF